LANEGDTADITSAMVSGYSHVMLNTALSLPIFQYCCVTMAAISGVYSKRAYSDKLQHHSLVKALPLSKQ